MKVEETNDDENGRRTKIRSNEGDRKLSASDVRTFSIFIYVQKDFTDVEMSFRTPLEIRY